MRQARIKVASDEGPGVYHAMSRTVNGEMLFDDVAKEVFRKMLGQVAEYCGVQLLTWTILTNHFHLVVRVPQKVPLSDQELVRRFEVLYPTPTRHEPASVATIKAQLAANGPEAAAWRQQQLARMGDISPFLQTLKQRFSIWFNKNHDRFGTLWAERFKSILVDPKGNALETLAAYVDLNCVRAGLAKDPKDYRFCGYAEAVADAGTARRGLLSIYGETANWDEAQGHYRQTLFGTGVGPHGSGAEISREDFERVVQEGGKLSLATVLRCRLRYFTDGAVLGSREFVEARLQLYRRQIRAGRRMKSNALPPVGEWGDLMTLRRVNQRSLDLSQSKGSAA